MSAFQLTSLPAEIIQLACHQQRLKLRGNQLTSLPAEIVQLTSLQQLDLSWNELTSLTREIGQLTSLEVLDLNGNQLTSLPREIGQLTSLRRLELAGNSLSDAITSLLERGIDDLLTYLRSVAEAEPLFEAKLLFVGEGKVGKSSLLAAMQGKVFIENRDTTHGLELASIELPHSERSGTCISLNAWDFGGQPVYRATHQFFFSRRSLYLVLWSPRLSAEQCDVEGWIKRIKLRVGKEAKVIVIATHCETEGRIARINETQLRRDHGDVIVRFHEVDSETNAGVEELKELIASVAAELPQMGSPLNRRWKVARDEVVNIQQPRISFQEYREICAKHGLDDQETSTLAELMDILGNIVYYANDDGLKDEVILQPEWMSKAIGYVLEDKETNTRRGVLPHARLREIWYDRGPENKGWYDPPLHPFFLRLMEKYDVSYRLEDEASSLVAQHVPDDQPDVPWCPEERSHKHQLRLVCPMSEQPPGLVPWMIVRTHRFSTEKHWQTGMFIEHGDHGTAFLELRDRDFHIAVRAEYPPHFMTLLSDTLTCLIDQRWPGLKYDLSVPCPNTRTAGELCSGRFRLDALRRFHAKGIDTIPCQHCVEDLSIEKLILGFDTTPDRDIVTRMEELHRGASIERRQLHYEASEERQKFMSQASELLRRAIRALSTETQECPRLFTLLPEDLNKINPANWGKSSQRLTLWCEYADLPHPTCAIGSGGKGEYVINPDYS